MEHINGSALVLVALLVWALYKARTSGKACHCLNLDDDLIAEGWTCYNCYEKNS